jgi:phage terminase small subunit
MKMHKDRLTERQRLFCEHYVGAGRHCAALAARLAGYAPGCSHVTGCQLLKKPKIAATVKGLEEVLAQEIGVSRQAVIAQLVAAAEQAKLMMEPSSIVSAMKNIAQISGYYRHDGVKRAELTDVQSVVQAKFSAMTDAELVALIGQSNAASH